MGKLIDGDELIELLLSTAITDKQREYSECVQYAVEKMPPVDAVTVVRCKDCKHHHYQNGIPYCDRSYWGWKDDDFCSSGERKDGNDD